MLCAASQPKTIFFFDFFKILCYNIYRKLRKELMNMNKKKKINKSLLKMTPEELEQWMHFRKAGSRVENRKGKGSYKRKPKYPDRSE